MVIKLIAPIIDEAPAKCKLNIAISTEPPEWAWIELKGGYMVHPVPAPCSISEDPNRSNKAGGKSQKLMLLSLGKAISGAPIYKGTNQFPNPPIKTGITKKKIIIRAWAVTTTLYNWSSPNMDPGPDSSNLIIILKAVPTIAEKAPNIKYSVPISLWLVENNHLDKYVFMSIYYIWTDGLI